MQNVPEEEEVHTGFSVDRSLLLLKPCVLEPGLHALSGLARDKILPRVLQSLTIEMKEG